MNEKILAFFAKWQGLQCDFDGAFGSQCVDLARQFWRDVFGVPHTGAVEGAKDLWLRWDDLPKEREAFQKVAPQSPSATFALGDVLVWDESPTNKWGHVAIFVAIVGGRILVFEQDGLKKDGAKFAVRSEKRLLGALRVKS